MTNLRSEIDYLHSILELLADIREGLGRIEEKLPGPRRVTVAEVMRDLAPTVYGTETNRKTPQEKADEAYETIQRTVRLNRKLKEAGIIQDASLSVRKEEGEDAGDK